MPIYCWCVSRCPGRTLVPVIIFTMAALYHPDITRYLLTSHLYFILPLHTEPVHWSVRPAYWLGQICGLILVISVVGRVALNCPVNQILIIAVFVFTSPSDSQEEEGGLGVSSWDIFVCNQSSDQSNEWEDEPSWRCKISQSVSWETHHSFVDWLSPPRLLWTEDFFQDCFVFHQKLNLPSQTRYTCGNSQAMRNSLSSPTSSLLAY